MSDMGGPYRNLRRMWSHNVPVRHTFSVWFPKSRR